MARMDALATVDAATASLGSGFGQFWILMQRGGPVMWPLLALSIVAVAVSLERGWFWGRLHRASEMRRIAKVIDALRAGHRDKVVALLGRDASPYAEVVQRLLDEEPSDALAVEAVECERPRLERFMNVLSTIVTAAPMLGILGTVLGIIRSFQLLGTSQTLVDPREVSVGIAEALITTAAGLIVALIALFPFMVFRAQSERALGRMESIVAAAQQGFGGKAPVGPRAE
jgi:biopolymer transport protein ExbB